VRLELQIPDIRYAFRTMRRSPLFAASVAATIGLGLGVLCSAFTILNAYVLAPIDLPDAQALYKLSWDTASARNRDFRLADFEAARESDSSVFDLTAGLGTAVMQDGVQLPGLLVSGNYFQVLGARPVMGRVLLPSDAVAPGGNAVAVLSEYAWRSRFGGDPAIVGKRVPLGRQSFEVVGVIRRGMVLPGQQSIGFWAPLTMAQAFEVADPWTDSNASLSVIGRLRDGVPMLRARAWLDVWLRQRFPPGSGSELEPVVVHVDSRSRLIPLTTGTLTMIVVILSAFGLVLLVACANVTNLMLARGFSRQREIAVRLSLGASRWRVVRQLIVESLMLAGPAAAVGLALTIATARIFPALILATFPGGIAPVETVLVSLDPDWRVLSVLVIAAVVSAVIVSLAPAVRVTRANLVRAARGEGALDAQRSHLRTGLVAVQIGACVMFLIGAIGLIDESRRLANPDRGLSFERVAEVRIAPRFRVELAGRLASDPLIERVAAAWQPSLAGVLRRVGVVPSETRLEQTAGFMAVSPEYFPLLDIQVVQGRAFTSREADEGAAVALVSAATAHAFWPGLDPVGQTLEIRRLDARSQGVPAHTSVRIIGVAEDVSSDMLFDKVDTTCVYFATSVRSSLEISLLVRSRADVADVRTAVVNAVNTLDPDAPYRIMPMRDLLGVMTWTFRAFSTTASLLGVVGLLLAFSGTYAVVAFLVAQRTPEFGIRMALGATVRQIVSAMMNETLRVALIGLGAGLALAMAVVRALSAAIEIIPRFGPRPYVVGVLIVLVATMVAALLPSLRAARIDPSKALRAE
jgi:predicted permease